MMTRLFCILIFAVLARATDIHDEMHACQFERLRQLKKSNFQATTAADEFCVGYGYWMQLEGLTHNPAQSASWMARAAQQGYPAAEVVLGYDYEQGHGVPRDYAKAVFWIRKAVEQNYADAMFHLGRLYETGKGVPQNQAAAIEWYQKAINGGSADGIAALRQEREYQQEAPARETAIRADRADQAGDFAGAAALYRAAAQAGNPHAQVSLGTMMRAGQGVPKDYAGAVAWFEKAAELNYAPALAHLGFAYELGEGVPTNWPKAQKLCEASAKQMDRLGLYCAARDFQFGIGIAQDRAKAIRLFDRAMDEGDGFSKYFSIVLRDPNTPVGFRDDAEREHYLLAWADPHGIRFNNPQERNQWLGAQQARAQAAGARAYAGMDQYRQGACQAAGGSWGMGNCHGERGIIFNPGTQDRNGNSR